MSTSPSSLPDCEETGQGNVSVVQSAQAGDIISYNPPSSPTVDNVINGASGDGTREETPVINSDTDNAEEMSLTGKSTDEESVVLEDVTIVNRSNKEKEQSVPVLQDLNKDIDAVLDYNVRNGQVDPNGSGNIQNITVDSTENSTLRIDVEEALFEKEEKSDKSEKCQNGFIEVLAEKVAPEAGSERSFTSDTDSSALAESVVKTVLDKAVDIVRAEDMVEAFDEKNEPETMDRVPEVPTGDPKVGMFQYQEFDREDGEEEEEDHEVDDEVNDKKDTELKQEDVMVGLFQYIDAEESDRVKSPEVSEIDDIIDDQVESMDEEEKSNILKLYGLEGVEPISPKSASPSESGPSSMEDGHQKVLDVQRDIYEPSTRHFSVTRDTSSSESTPRIDKNSEKSDNLNNNGDESNDGSDPSEKVSLAESQKQEFEIETDVNNSGIENAGKAEASLPASISPPLVQYEPVKENGKFRIIKTTKEGGGTSFSAIRVGGDVVSPKESPRSVESQKESPRETLTNGFESEHSATSKKSENGYSPDEQLEVNSEKLKEKESKVSLDKLDIQDVMGTSATKERNLNNHNANESVELDRDKIRKLLEKENAPLKLSLSKDSSVSRDSGVPSSQYSGKFEQSNKKPSQHMTMPQLQTSQALPFQERETLPDSELSRIRYTTKDTAGREVKRMGPRPYDMKEDRDRLASDSRYLQVQDGESLPHDRERYVSEDYSRSDRTRDSSRHSSNYEEDLLKSAYERISHKGQEKPHTAPAVKSHDTRAIPGFKTLQDQQAKWSDMFHNLEDEHRRDLRSQYDRHQYNIQRLQQQMELELQKQHLAIRKKLDIHKEALAKMSPDRDSSTRYRSSDRSLSPERDQRSPDRVQRSPDRGQRSKGERSATEWPEGQNKLEKLHGEFDSKTWREIYREVREEEEQQHSPSRPLKRSLDDDFATIDSGLDRSRPPGQRSSPRGSSDLSRSGSREMSREATLDSSQRTPTNVRFSKAERDRSLGKDGQRSFDRELSPEGRDSRSYDRESRSRSFGREAVSPLPAGDGAPQESVSRHVRELLDNLNDSRHSLQDLEDGASTVRPTGYHSETGNERPRAGVYSSPMPFLSGGRFSKSTDKSMDTSANMDSSHMTQSLPVGRDRAEFYSERPRTTGGRDRKPDSFRLDDSSLSPSTRMNLREKHSKHLADLRTYYEDELRELRKALSDTMDTSAASVNTSMQSSAQTQLVEAENKHLADRCRTLEDETEEMQMQIRTLEQKNHGLEKRASEYAAAFTDSQTMSIQHRAHIEELQRYCRERDDLINELESKMVSNEDSVKIYKKNLEDEMELHRQDKISLQRMMDRYESLEREFKLLQETMNSTENKLYETRTDVVELNRTISKLELENKRLGRENDNLRHKVTQSLNLSQLHESFGNPSSPREIQNCLNPRSPASGQHDTSVGVSQPVPKDKRVPGFAISMQDWTPAQKSRPKSAEVNRSKTEGLNVSQQSVVQKEKKESRPRRKETGEPSKGRQSEKSTGARIIRDDSSLASSREDVSNRSQSRKKDTDQTPVRDRTPQRREITSPRSASPCSQAESEVSDYSPLLKAERELFKLRDMMRQAVAVKPSVSPPQPKLQKKFYGSERPSGGDEYTPDLGVARGRKDKASINSHSSVAKTKHSQTPVKLDKSNSKRSASGKSEKSSKSKERVPGRDEEKRERGKERADRETRRQRDTSPPSREEFSSSSTRFDIDFNEEDKSLTVTPRKSGNQSGKQKNLLNGDAGDLSKEVKQVKSATKETNTGAEGQVENTLDMMRSGRYTSRPEWENIYTSLAKSKSESQERQRNMEEKVKERLRSITEMESRYDGLQVEKRQLESSINKIPLHGRVDRNNRRQKEELENQLDAVERELGSLRMTLKRYNVLKTAG